MIYATVNGVEIPTKIIRVINSSMLVCLIEDREQEFHRNFITADRGNAEIEAACDRVGDNV